MNKNQIDQYIKICCKTTDMFDKLKSFIMEKTAWLSSQEELWAHVKCNHIQLD
jgi:hypothetical protein